MTDELEQNQDGEVCDCCSGKKSKECCKKEGKCSCGSGKDTDECCGAN